MTEFFPPPGRDPRRPQSDMPTWIGCALMLGIVAALVWLGLSWVK